MPESVRRRMQVWPAGEHPDADLLTGFAEHTLTASERERVTTHLAACGLCRDIVSLALPEVAEAEVVAPQPHGWFHWQKLRWAALAATVVVVGAAVSTLVPRREQRTEQHAEVAQLPKEAPTATNSAVPANGARQDGRQEGSAEQESRPTDLAKKKAASAATTQNHPVPTPPPPPISANATAAEEAKSRSSDKLTDSSAALAQPVLKDGRASPSGQPVVVGKVLDPSGAAIPNATVKITNADTKQTAAARTDASGGYKFDAVSPGAYSVEAAAPGMQAAKNEVQVSRDTSQNLTLKPQAVNESVEVAAARPGYSGQVLGGTGKDQQQAAAAPPPAQQQAAQADAVQGLRAQAVPQAASGGAIALSKAMRKPSTPFRWRVGAKGAIERSSDGSTWEQVAIDPGVTFRSMSSNDGELWAGGTGGALFHSSDAGRTWSRVKVGSEGMWVSETIASVDFPSARSGYVTTASGAVWFTEDAGRTWQRRQ